MDITRVASLRRDGACRWELAATHMVHTGTLHSVMCSVVLFILAVSLTWLAHSVGSNLGRQVITESSGAPYDDA